MKVRVYSTSGPSWQPIKDGKRYNRWVGTIQFSDVEHVLFGKRYTATVSGFTKEDVEAQLARYQFGSVVSVPTNKLHGFFPGNAGGKYEI